MRVLILGGTAEARDLASALQSHGIHFASSLAGRVSQPRLPVGEVRIGGFGGIAGLEQYLHESGVTHVIDATHPFAATMSRHAAEAASAAHLPLIRLERPGWGTRPDAAHWHWEPDLTAVRTCAEALGTRPFITSGRQTLHAFEAWGDRQVLVRVVEALDAAKPDAWTVIRDRGPYSLHGELTLMRTHGIDVLITKDSGGTYTSAKLDAAQQLGIPVVVLQRPPMSTNARAVTDVEECLTALLA